MYILSSIEYGKNMTTDYKFKIIVIGNAGVGKTAMVAHYVGEPVPKTYVPTRDKNVKGIVVSEGKKKICLQIWDLPGDEKDRTLTSAYYFDAHGVAIAYSMSDSDSFINVKDWMKSVEQTVPPNSFKDMVKVIVGLKMDQENLSITETHGEHQARGLGCKHFTGTIKNKSSFRDMFQELVVQILQKEKEKDLEEFVITEQVNNNHSLLIGAQQKSDKDDKKEEKTPGKCDCGCIVM